MIPKVEPTADSARRRIGVFEPDAGVAQVYRDILSNQHDLVCFERFSDLCESLKNESYALIIAEAKEQGKDITESLDHDSLRKLRNIPVLVVSKDTSLDVMSSLLTKFANDFVLKPFNVSDFAIKCNILAGTSQMFHCDAITLRITRNGIQSEELTAMEFRLMSIMLTAPLHHVAAKDITCALWGKVGTPQKLHTTLSRLRSKLKPLNLDIQVQDEQVQVNSGAQNA